jgi:hypothetical protein
MNPPPLITNILELFGIKDQKAQIPTPTPKKITDEDLLQVIDEVYLKAKDMLMKGRYNKVVEGLLFYINYDICFRKILTSQLTNTETFGENKIYLAEEIMDFIVIIQSYFNSFRVNLLSDIVRFINNEYNRVLDLLPISFQQATVKFNKTNGINLFFINRLKDWHFSLAWDERDDITENMYEESVAAFKELKLNATRHLQRIIDEQLRKL